MYSCQNNHIQQHYIIKHTAIYHTHTYILKTLIPHTHTNHQYQQVLEGKLDKSEGAALNAVLGAHVLRVTSLHARIDQSRNEEFEKFETRRFNWMFRDILR